VNAFNRATTRDDLYFAVFGASDALRWDGNLKKFKLAVDKSTTPPSLVVSGQGATVTDAIDPDTGFFKDSTQSYWSDEQDGNDIGLGGAASKLPDPSARKIYTYLGTNPKGSSATVVELTDSSVNDTVLGTNSTPPTRSDILDFAYAKDNKRLGDPLHSEPAVVTYGGTAAAPQDVVYVATNDGFLHAVDAADASGVEKWAYVPKELLPRLKMLYDNPSVVNRTYGLDGDIRVLRLDLNQNGIIEPRRRRGLWLRRAARSGRNVVFARDHARQHLRRFTECAEARAGVRRRL
jgi:type IV pilus assembly protein PilY1